MITEEELLGLWEDDARLNKENLTDESLRIASLHPKYLRILMQSKRERAKLQNSYDKTKHLITRYYHGTMEKVEMDKFGLAYDPFNGASKPLKSNMGPWIDNDVRMQRAYSKLSEANDIVSAIEEIINTIRWRHNAIKNILESKKFDAGF